MFTTPGSVVWPVVFPPPPRNHSMPLATPSLSWSALKAPTVPFAVCHVAKAGAVLAIRKPLALSVKLMTPAALILPSCVVVSPLALVPKRSVLPETKVPVRVSVPVLQSTALLSANQSAPPVPKRMVAAPVRSSVPAVSVRVSASRVAAPMETLVVSGST